MKKKFTIQDILLLTLLLICVYKFTYLSAEKSGRSITITDDSLGFRNYVTAPGWSDTAPGNFWNITNQLNSYKELNYNASQMFVSDSDSLGKFSQSVLRGDQKQRLQRIANESNQLGLVPHLERVNISALCYSQRLIYEVGIDSSINNRNINYGFAYEYNMDSAYTIDSNRTVLHARKNIDTAGWLCKNIYENLQHTDLYYFWPGSTDNFIWKIKPVMRIRQSDFSPFDTTEVVAIITKNYLGNTIDSTVIKVENFRNDNNQYFGQYVDKYNLIPLLVNGHIDSTNSLSYGRPAPGWDIKNCKVDFKVYWHGNVDVWFDKMIVDDERADLLFNGLYDIKIADEVSTFNNHPIVFYVDELVSSQTHTTKYVRDKMGSGVKMQFALSNNLNLYSHRDSTLRNKMLFDFIQPDIVCLDDHVFLCDSQYLIYLPNNADGYDPKVPEHWKKSPSEYNTRLQTMAFGNKSEIVTPFQGTFIYQIAKVRDDLRQLSPHTKFVVQPHLHSWTMTVENEGYKDNGFREPTNQEIQASAMLAIAHGAQGLSWVNYQSNTSSNINAIHDTLVTPNDTGFTIFGLRNDDSTKRTSNIIHQDKWEYVKAMNLKILHWKPTLDKVKWDSGYSVHSEGANHNFISEIKSIIVHSGPPTPCADVLNYDCPEHSYWEMGFFKPDLENPAVYGNDKSKYFMMVNRRCVPEINNDGDLRQLKIKFNSSQLTGFNNWKIIELDSNKVIRTFDKDSNIYVDMKIFLPGEGRLYKLSPVMQEGGELVTDEVVAGGSFNCNGDVFNNGKNVTISPNTIVNFADGVKWDFTAGEFICGSMGDNPIPLPVTLTSQTAPSRAYWKGIMLNQCYNVEIENTVMSYLDNSTTALQLIDCIEFNINHNIFILTDL